MQVPDGPHLAPHPSGIRPAHWPEAAADLLLRSHRSNVPLDGLPENLAPRSFEEAYLVQDLVVSQLGGVGGWKVGARGPEADPTCAPLPLGGIQATGHVLSGPAFAFRGVEAEVCIRLARDLPDRGCAYSVQEVERAIASVCPAIEVVQSRFRDMAAQGRIGLLADAVSHGALILGEGVPYVTGMLDIERRVRLEAGRELLADKVGGNPAGQDLLRLVVWLANHLTARRGGLRAGEYVTTGSFTGMIAVPPETQVTAALQGLGSVTLRFGQAGAGAGAAHRHAIKPRA